MELKKTIKGLTFNGKMFVPEDYEIIYKKVNGREWLSVDNGQTQFIIPIEE